MGHGPELFVVAVVCVVLAAGVALRSLRRFVKIPYTVGMLVLGVAAGLVVDPEVAQRLHVSPDLIIFVFLPALIFESVLALDVHAFFENLGGMLLLAVPALLVSTALTAAAMVFITGGTWTWSWSVALVFGALISATDPVAVVALLREVGAPKRLGILIEGESLLNDGTAIVVFTVLVSLLAAPDAPADLVSILGSFAIVVAGGVMVGLVLAILLWAWIGRIFDDPMVEITLTVVLAYLAMVVAESQLHVSGVIAIVVAGLWLAGPGRSSTSPEVSTFLHHFWELLSYGANTIIFFLVGVLVACQVPALSMAALMIALTSFVVIMVIRGLVVFSFRGLIGKIIDPISTSEAGVIAWGGLRGAVSLALALIVNQDPSIPETTRVQILGVTSLVVALTIVVNGSTMGALLERLGLTATPPALRWIQVSAERSILDRLLRRLQTSAGAHRGLALSSIIQQIEARRAVASRELQALTANEENRRVRYWQRAMAMERQAYWSAFSDGVLGATATAILDRDVEHHRGWLHDALDDEVMSRPLSRTRLAISRLVRRQKVVSPAQLYLLSLEYDLARGQALAARAVVDGLRDLDDEHVGSDAESIVFAYTEQLLAAQTRLEDLRTNLPELTRSIELRLGQRIALNIERDLVSAAARDGLIDQSTADEKRAHIEAAMKRLSTRLRSDALPSVTELCADSPLLQTLDDDAKLVLAASSKEVFFTADELLFHEGDEGSSAYFIARGAVQVFVGDEGAEQTLDILGGGDVLGEVALLTGQSRTASARAITTVAAAEIERSSLLALMAAQPKLDARIWDGYAQRQLDNHLRGRPGFEHLDHLDRLHWIEGAPHAILDAGESIPAAPGRTIFVLLGAIRADGLVHHAPSLVTSGSAPILAIEPSRVVVLPVRPLGADQSGGALQDQAGGA